MRSGTIPHTVSRTKSLGHSAQIKKHFQHISLRTTKLLNIGSPLNCHTLMPTKAESARNNQELQRFPERLFQLLDQAERENFSHVISWQPHGRCFLIHQLDQFKALLSVLMPGMMRWKSFQRQLRRWGFTRLVEGRDCHGYYNEHFLRYRPHLLSHLRCAWDSKRTGLDLGSSRPAPNFYLMPFLTPLPTSSVSSGGTEKTSFSSTTTISAETTFNPAANDLFDQPANNTKVENNPYVGRDGHNSSSVGAHPATLPGMCTVPEDNGVDEPVIQFVQTGPETQATGVNGLQRKSLFGAVLDSDSWLIKSDNSWTLDQVLEPRPLPPIVTQLGQSVTFSYTPIPVAHHPGFSQIGPQEFYFNSRAALHTTETDMDGISGPQTCHGG
jgi:HSF-type DNA-binding